MDGLKEVPGVLSPVGIPAAPALPPGVAEGDATRLFGAAYRMLGSACRALEVVQEAVAASAAAPSDEPYDRLVREVFGATLRSGERERVRVRRDGQAPVAAWLAEPVLTAGGALGPMDTAELRESVSMARLVLLERLAPGERAAWVLHEVFDYGPEAGAAVLGVPEARYTVLERRARQRVQDAESAVRSPDSEASRWSAAAELLGAIREEDPAALEELLAEDVVAWSDGGGQPGVVRRPVLGAAKVGRFLAGVRGRIPQGASGHIAEVNGGAALVAAAGSEVVGVLAPEFGPQGLVGIRAVADPARLVFAGRQWADRGGRSGTRDGVPHPRDPV
ncbi:RNA polymerase sigma-70 factor, ECF subfamily [Streptomyces sp. DvalAA-14]|uniref:RNA polymerase subunit sigma-24 n=1 Tax=unclassified Streptomyces TaxID=2593676 RepID=UPI00081B1029|nr:MULTISPECIES: RNA polymerase subunit sigma-24 [unclassified Streptomyces]MYS21678.1 RNA polymerase subunit sigma-24 [Streptomyces sp. SID4948]SCD98739.1 RNA polymerase sigma-70 factor, ECF subfamily [Streptomyces sp. DvalAA-14]